MTTERLRIGIVGAGSIVRERHMPGFAAIEGVEVVTVCNRSMASGAVFAEKYAIPHVCTDWREVVGNDEVDAILIGTWPYMHREIALAAFDVGKHVFCQARMACTASEARGMEEVWLRSGLTAMLCPPPIAMYAARPIRKILESGRLGKVLTACVRHVDGAYLDPYAPLGWRLNREYQGLNTLTLGMYAEVLHGWFGPTSTISARTRIQTPKRLDPETGESQKVEIAEEVFAHGVLQNGIHTHYMLSGLMAHGGDCTIEVFGTEGSMKYVLQGEEVWFGKKDEPLQKQTLSDKEIQPWRVEADFVEAVRQGVKDPTPSFSDGVNYMNVTEAVSISAQNGGTEIRLPG